MKHKITFHKSGQGKAQCPSDPAYPHGKKISVGVQPACEVEVPYPAPECGHWFIDCSECGALVVVTVAGRPDDPISVSVPCKVINITGAQ